MSERRADRGVVVAIIMALLVAVALLGPLSVAGLATSCAVAGIYLGFQKAGWIGGARRLTRVACHSDGIWVLEEAGGRTYEAHLACASRVAPFALWLTWAGRPRHSLLLLRGDLPQADFKRLVVRLRLSARLVPGEVIRES